MADTEKKMAVGTTIAIALGCLLAGGVGGGLIVGKAANDRAAEADAQATALKSVADAQVNQTEAVGDLTTKIQALEAMRGELRADLAGAAGLPVACLTDEHSLQPACMAVKCWQFQQSDAGRSAQTECTEWSRLARKLAEPLPLTD